MQLVAKDVEVFCAMKLLRTSGMLIQHNNNTRMGGISIQTFFRLSSALPTELLADIKNTPKIPLFPKITRAKSWNH